MKDVDLFKHKTFLGMAALQYGHPVYVDASNMSICV